MLIYGVATDHIDMIADQLIHRVDDLRSKSLHKRDIILSVQMLLDEHQQILAPTPSSYPHNHEINHSDDVIFGRSDCEFIFRD